MIDILCSIIELTVVLPGLLLAYLPMKKYIKIKPVKLLAIIAPIFLLLCAVGGIISYLLKIGTLFPAILIILIIGITYCKTVKITLWKSISVFLAVCGVFSCISSLAVIIDAVICPNNTSEWFCLNTGLIYNLICWVLVIVAWRPATHEASDLLDNEIIAQTWYVFWILPILFIALNLFMVPINSEILYKGRIMQGYLLISLALLVLLVLFYAMFYLIAKNINQNHLLTQQNQFLSMQQTQYETLSSAIDETRQARHNMRHHFSTLNALAKRKEWQELEEYLVSAQETIPSAELNLCDNPAVDGISGHYCFRYKENDIPFSIKLDLPYKLPIVEMDVCLVLSNLLENALEASLRINKEKRHISVQAYLHSVNVVLITVENTFDGNIDEKNGVFQSSKRHGDGVGIQSIRRIAEKNGGYCRFTWRDDIFCANVMLRGDKNNSI